MKDETKTTSRAVVKRGAPQGASIGMTERGVPEKYPKPGAAGGGPSNGADGNFWGNRPCDFCGAKAPVWDIRVFRREDQTDPDFRLTVCGNCLPRVNARLEERIKRETWTSETWNK